MFTPAASPGLKVIVIIRVRVTTIRTCGSYFPCCLFVQFFPIVVAPSGSTGTLLLMVVIWLGLGMILDSASIILLTVPIFAPIAMGLGFDPIAFAIIGILAIEMGLLTPPVGLLVYTVKGAVPDGDVTLGEIFSGAMPYWMLILVAMTLVWIFPALATWLPG